MNTLIELNKIRDDFQNDVQKWFDIAHAFLEIISLGSGRILYEELNLELTSSFSIPCIVNGKVLLDNFSTLTLGEIGQIYLNHKGAIAELVYKQFIQQWYDFLAKIFEQIIKYHIQGVKIYTNISSEFQDKQLKYSNRSEEFLKKAYQYFDRKNNSIQKTEKIAFYLEKNISINLKEEIKKAIFVRNLLEHNQGIIREEDIEKLDNQTIKLIDSHAQYKDFILNEKVEITIYELYKLKQVFDYTAKELIPD